MVLEERESDDEEVAGDAGPRQFVWDAAKGMLVEAPAPEAPGKQSKAKAKGKLAEAPAEAGAASAASAAPAESSTAEAGSTAAQEAQEGAPAPAKTDQAAEGDAAEGEGSEEETASSDGEGEEDAAALEADSRAAFLSSASTPELIKQAVAVGGALADGVKDRWVLDRATKLYFRFDMGSQKMYCWNPDQGCMYLWHGRGKLEFQWASASGASAPPPVLGQAPPAVTDAPVATAGGGAEAPDAAMPSAEGDGEAPAAEATSLWVTVIPPTVLVAGGVAEPDEVICDLVELSSKALTAISGKGGAGLKELEKCSGAKLSAEPPKDGETVRHLKIEGTRPQIATAKAALEQRVMVTMGKSAAEKMQKHLASELLSRKRAETGADAAKAGVKGLSEFAQQWGLKGVMARKLARLDAMLQRYMIRHFNPQKAKPANAIRNYTVALLKHPQRWRLEALYEDGELEGEVCETVVVRAGGAVVGRQRSAADEEAEDAEAEQFIELEVNETLGEREASKIYGDVQPQHCRLLRMGQDFYVWAMDSQVGTIVDGHKYRQQDGPVELRDGAVIGVGKYLFYCEVGTPAALDERRKRLVAGERFWKAGAELLEKVEGKAAAAGSGGAPTTAADGSAEGAAADGAADDAESDHAGESSDEAEDAAEMGDEADVAATLAKLEAEMEAEMEAEAQADDAEGPDGRKRRRIDLAGEDAKEAVAAAPPECS